MNERREMVMNYIEDFKAFRVDQKISPNTINMEIKYLTKFHTFFNVLYKKQVPIWEIRLKDVVAFFDEESKYLKDRTLYRKITIISIYYDFLWSKGHVPIDFMEKFRQHYRKLEWEPPKIRVDYQVMLDKKVDILTDSNINLMPKLIYLLLLRGVALADMLRIQINGIVILDNTLNIIYETNKDEIERTLVYDDPIEIGIVKEGITLAEQRNVPYLLSSKSEGKYTSFNPVNLHDMVSPIESKLGFPIKSTNKVMYAYIYYLATTLNKNVNQMSQILAMSIPHTVKVLNAALERMENISYNENIK